MNAFALADKAPVSALGQGAMGQPRVPSDWNANRSTVDEFNGERILGHRHVLRPRLGKITRKW